MALVKKFDNLGAGNRGRVHGEVDCTYATFEVEGRRYLQLDTYGSSDRAFPGKISQSIQIDVQGARQLKRLLDRTFPGVSAL